MNAEMELIYSSNRCDLEELKRLQGEPATEDCEAFDELILRIQASVIYTYQITAFLAIRLADPSEAAKHWQYMVAYCDSALTTIRKLKDNTPQCGAANLYDLVLSYRGEADKRRRQNQQDSECTDPAIAKALFPQMN